MSDETLNKIVLAKLHDRRVEKAMEVLTLYNNTTRPMSRDELDLLNSSAKFLNNWIGEG